MMTGAMPSGTDNPVYEGDSGQYSDNIPLEDIKRNTDVETGEKNVEKEGESMNTATRLLIKLREHLHILMINHTARIKLALLVVFLVLYSAYFIALVYNISVKNKDILWCQGSGFIIIITAFASFIVTYYVVFKKLFGAFLRRTCCDRLSEAWTQTKKLWYVRWGIYIILLLTIIIFLAIDTQRDRERLRSALGLVTLIAAGFLFSKDPSKIKWSQVWWGVGLQFIFGLLILRWDTGEQVFECLGNKTNSFLSFTDKGSSFVYGDDLVQKHVFYFKALSVIFYFSFVVQILHYYGIMQLLVKKIGWLLYVTIGTTACESMNAAANIFLGQSEAPLMIKPYLEQMTNSELHAVMTGGFATIAGSVLAAYIAFGVNASHLLGASVMSAPAALAYAKLFYPETGISQTKAENIDMKKGDEANFLDAAAKGASGAIMLVLTIAANLIAFTAAINFLNTSVEWMFLQLDIEGVDFIYILAHIFYPIAWIMGVPKEDCLFVGELLGTKTIVNEFVAYERYGDYLKEGNIVNPRTEVIVVYSLCGFSNLTSIGVQIAALGKMAPKRKEDLARIAFRAFLAGSAACFMTACIAGMLIHSPQE